MPFQERPSTARRRYLLVAKHLAMAFEAGEERVVFTDINARGTEPPDKVGYLAGAIPSLLEALEALQ